MSNLIRSSLWLSFFGAILLAWWMLYVMAMDMGVDFLGRPGPMAQAMANMDPRMPMDMPMARFGPLFLMWAIMMAAMMLPTLVPTLTTYERLMTSADGTRAGWSGVLLGYFIVWVGFAALIAGIQIALLYGGVINMLGIAPKWISALSLIVVGAFQFTRLKEVCHGVCHAPMTYFLGNWK
ncbi:MAG: putative metal-binding membrane protein, partial [Yoonia sp.]